MNKRFTSFMTTGSLLLLASAARAQGTFSFGPQVGLNVSTAQYLRSDFYHTQARLGFEGGLLGSFYFGRITLQPALLFSQRGYHLTSGADPNVSTGQHDDHFRLNYLTLPAKVLFTPRKDGQGVQFFVGAYVSMLVGGHYERNFTFNGATTRTEGPIIPNQSPLAYEEYSAQRVDGGMLAGLGYRYRRVQVQLNYSWGQANLAVDYYFKGQRLSNPIHTNRAFQASLAYLLPLH